MSDLLQLGYRARHETQADGPMSFRINQIGGSSRPLSYDDRS